MRRQLAIAAVCSAMLAIPLSAQMHGGGARGGGSAGRGGFSSGALGSRGSGFSGAAGFRSGTNFRGGTGFGGASFGTFGRFGGQRGPGFRHFGPPFAGSRFRASFGFGQPFFSPGFRRRGFYPFYTGFYYGYPYDSGYLYSTSGYSPGYDYYASPDYYGASNAAQYDIARQQQDIDRLENEVERLREQREAPRPSRSQVEKYEPSTPTILVFRDKHTQEVQNYAVVGGTLWIFNEQRATKLPLSWLDIEATTQANDDRGVDFQIPR
jgi:hypothetical protein